jgi:hypothetical protein
VLGRTPVRKRMRAKLRQIKEQLKATRHDGVEAQGKWLAQVLRGWLAYYAVPMSAPAITAFRHHLVDRWLHAIRRRPPESEARREQPRRGGRSRSRRRGPRAGCVH